MLDHEIIRDYPSFDKIHLPSPNKRDLFFTKQVDQDSIAELAESIIAIEKHDEYLVRLYALHNLTYTPEPINIYIDSYGGIVYQCFGLLSIMEQCRTPIHTVVTGTAMSCGFLIAITGHQRSCYKNSTYMYHQISTGVMGTVRDIQAELTEASRLQDKVEAVTLAKTKFTPENLEEIYDGSRDFYMSAPQAKQLGCVDKIIGEELPHPPSVTV